MTITAIKTAVGATPDAYEHDVERLRALGFQPRGDMIWTGSMFVREMFQGVIDDVAINNLSELFWVEVNAAATTLDGAGYVLVAAGAAGIQYLVRDITLHGGGTNFGGGGNRLLDLTDGTTVYTQVANADLESAPTASLRWGNAKVPMLTNKSAVKTVEGEDLVFAYSGGTTDHTTGSIKFAVLLERVAV